MNNVGLALLPLLAVLLATAWRRSRPGGAPAPSWRQGAVFASAFFWIAFSAVGLAALGQTRAPISRGDWREAVAAVIVIGAVPLGAFLLIDTALGLTRRWEAAARARANQDA